ncbi:MAG TPA: glycoside hydrolase family 32 protein [Planctomycetota bacterium]|nr:glycoside hydrolase family 32 protein [Planctomycetota bacterium]
MRTTALLILLAFLASARAAEDILFADFEGADYGAWKTTGDAFGSGPAHGDLPGQMHVDGYLGKGYVNSFHGGDKSTGTLVSPEFKIERKYITFLIGGGGFAGKTCMNLVIGGKTERTATGPNTQPGGSETLERQTWDVSELAGKSARIEIIDDATGGWGHINVDHIVFTDTKPLAIVSNLKREIVAQNAYLHLPVKTGAPKRKMSVKTDAGEERRFEIELVDGADAEWWASMDIAAWRGKTLTVGVDKLPENSNALAAIEQSDTLKSPPGAAELYREPLRGQLHFSARRGWNNDPNGMVFFEGEYHLFFQHNPYGWAWGNMHWGHAVSRDMLHWEERPEVLYPDNFGAMYSGSAVVDWKNTSGFGKDGVPPIVLIYTAAGADVQCLAYSSDKGKTFTKFNGNPMVKKISGGNRDPKVMWHEPTQKWVMTLYVDIVDENQKDAKDNAKKIQTIHFLSSPNLKDWTVMSHVDSFFECPDFFELPVDGNLAQKKWVLTAASSDYMLGSFDGTTFTPETPKLKGHRGRGFYAAQTFSDIPAADGRRIQIGWLQTATPKMPFNQSMSLPNVLTLLSTPEGPRLAWNPAKELETLRVKSVAPGAVTVKPGENPLKGVSGELLELRATFEPGEASEIGFTVRGVPVDYDLKKQELSVNGVKASAPLRNGRQTIIVYADRTALEVYASDGLTYVPLPMNLKSEEKSVEVVVKGGEVKFQALEAHELRSIWEKR